MRKAIRARTGNKCSPNTSCDGWLLLAATGCCWLLAAAGCWLAAGRHKIKPGYAEKKIHGASPCSKGYCFFMARRVDSRSHDIAIYRSNLWTIALRTQTLPADIHSKPMSQPLMQAFPQWLRHRLPQNKTLSATGSLNHPRAPGAPANNARASSMLALKY